MDTDEAPRKSRSRRTRLFVRFGEIPEGGKSRMWTAPNAYMVGRVGETLPGLSAYEVKKQGKKWVLNTDDINVGSGIASLYECFDRALAEPETNRIYLLRGAATSWKNMTPAERKQFDDWYPGKGCEGFDLLGTDGEPLVRDFEIVSVVNASDLVCAMISYPEDWDDFPAGMAEQGTVDADVEPDTPSFPGF